ncbi:hypothetical protein LLG95_17335 [bacterium]|nr:hypothetical protein [bacterium]
MASKKKIMIWTGLGCLSILVLFGLFGMAMVSRSAEEFNKFQQQHTNAGKALAEAARPIIEWKDSGGTATQGRAEKPPIQVFDPSLEISTIAREYLADMKLRRGFGPRPLYEISFILPAEDFPDEGTTGTVLCRASLRKRVAEEVAQNAAGTMYFARRFDRKTSNPLAAYFGRKPEIIDHAQRILTRNDLRWPDPVQMESFTRDLSIFDYAAELSLLRASLGADDANARKIFANMLRADLLNRLWSYTAPDRQRSFFRGLEPFLLMTAETNWLGNDAIFKDAAELLGGFKLNEKQAAALRAMRVMGMRQSLYEPQNVNGTKRAAVKAMGVMAWVFMDPIARGWADGDRDVYEAGMNRVAVMRKIFSLATGKSSTGGFDTFYFPYRYSGFTGEIGVNLNIEELQIVIAMARYRLAMGHYPGSMDDLVPRYLDRAILQKRQGGWGVTLLPAGTYPMQAWALAQDQNQADLDGKMDRYRKLYGRWPQNAEELVKVGAGDAETSGARKLFTAVEQRPIVFLVEREWVSREFLNNRLKYRDRKNIADLLGRMTPGQDQLAVLNVTAKWPQPEFYWDEVKDRIRQQASAVPGR